MKNLLKKIAASLRDANPPVPAQMAGSSPTPQEIVASALIHHGAGRLAEAESLYRKALAFDAENFDALHMLGVVHLQTGQSARAVELIEQAINVVPGNGLGHSNLGLAYQALNRMDDAVASLRRAVALLPDWDSAHNTLGTMLWAVGQTIAAEASFRTAALLNRKNADALNNLGNVLRERGRFSDAEGFHRQALAVDPAASGTWRNLGVVLKHSGRLDEAMECLRKALELQPEDAGTLSEIGSAHAACAELVEAEAYFRRALQLDGNRADALCNLGEVLRRLDRLEEAEALCRKAMAVQPDNPDILNTLACVLLRTRDLDEAEVCCRKALAIRKDLAAAHITMGSILNARDRSRDAEACFRLALQLAPDSAVARYNLSMLQLLHGNYEEGLALYESRFETLQVDFGAAPAIQDLLKDPRRWQGEKLSGRRLLIWAEQGFGDSLMMLRYLPMLKERGAGEVIVLCDRALERVVGSIAGLADPVLSVQSVSASAFELHCPVMSLPFMFGTTLESVPGSVPYIAVPENLRDVWKARLSSIAKPRVGLAWAGSKTLREDARRSIPLSAFEPVIRCEGVQLVSLQKEVAAKQAGAWRGQIQDWMDYCDDFLDTAAFVENLDLVISVDSAVAHLAGALGKPTWLLNRHGSEWRWGLESQHSPWYPSMRIFRQPVRDGWDGLISRVAEELELFQRKQNDRAQA